MNKAYAIFDMDGTLVDSMGYWKQLGREYLVSKGITEGIEDALERIKTMTMKESVALFTQEFGISGTAESIAEEMNALMDAHYRDDVVLKPGVRAYLDLLRRKQVKLCVASATCEKLVARCLSRLGIADYFSCLLSCEMAGVGKSRPDIYFLAAEKLGAKPEETAVYEDALYAAVTAKKAGFYVVGVYDESASQEWKELAELADEVIEDWERVKGEQV